MPCEKDAKILCEQFGHTMFTHWPHFDGEAPPGQIKELISRYIPVRERGSQGSQYSRKYLSKRQATAARFGDTRSDAESLSTLANPANHATPAPTSLEQAFQQGLQQGLQQVRREGFQQGWDECRNYLENQDALNPTAQDFNLSGGSIPNAFQFRGNEGSLGRNENFEENSDQHDRLTRDGQGRFNNDQRKYRPSGRYERKQREYENRPLGLPTREERDRYERKQREYRPLGLPTREERDRYERNRLTRDGHDQPTTRQYDNQHDMR